MVKIVPYFIVTVVALIPNVLYSQGKMMGIPEMGVFNREMYDEPTQKDGVVQSSAKPIYLTSNNGVLECGLVHINRNELSGICLSNLHEGNDEFMVQPKAQFGIKTQPLSFIFVAWPSWYRSILENTSYVILFACLGVFVFIVFNRRVRLKCQKEIINQEEKYKINKEQLKNAVLISEKEMIKIRNEKIRDEMAFKEKELVNSTGYLIQKNDLLIDIKLQLKKIIKISEKRELERAVSGLILKIDHEIDSVNNWELFETYFGQVHENFIKQLKEKHPNLNNREQRLCAYIKMGISSKDIASLMNITSRAVENNRYKLRQKLGLGQGENLHGYIERV